MLTALTSTTTSTSAATSTATNIVVNGGFENSSTSYSPWTIQAAAGSTATFTVTSSYFRSGTNSFDFKFGKPATPPDANLTQIVNVKVGSTYRIALFGEAPVASSGCSATVFLDNLLQGKIEPAGGTTWIAANITTTFTATSATATLKIDALCTGNAAASKDLYIDDVTMVQIS
ncbi:hypothetical protein LTR66_000857 [Elasticomyces elasticus]|nr:hypothetical protein LTR66_000857 [Elasticomyces elasticus]KAK5011738.1 hypothetical protein LTR28_006374 [Elasticomyces elasticus]